MENCFREFSYLIVVFNLNLSGLGKIVGGTPLTFFTFSDKIIINLFRGNKNFLTGNFPRNFYKLPIEVFSCDSQVVSTTCFFFYAGFPP